MVILYDNSVQNLLSRLILGQHDISKLYTSTGKIDPAKILGIDRGVLAPGKVADITVVNPTEEYDIDSNRFASKGKNTPFEGMHVYGKVLYTLVNGRVVYSDHNGTEILIEREVPKL